MGHTLKNSTGASLIEIMLTVVIITVTALLILSFSRNTFSMSKDARNTDAAYQSAEKLIDSLKAEPFPTSGSDTDVIDNQTFKRNWEIIDSPYISFAKIDVEFTSLKGKTRTITLAGAVQ